MDKYSAALRAMARPMPIEERLKVTPQQLEIYEELGGAGMGSIKNAGSLSRGVKLDFPSDTERILRTADKKYPSEEGEAFFEFMKTYGFTDADQLTDIGKAGYDAITKIRMANNNPGKSEIRQLSKESIKAFEDLMKKGRNP